MIHLTVSFFTKETKDKKRGIANAILYGFFIFLIYTLLSVPFYFLDSLNPEILNNISTNVWLNIFFFVVFIVFALSFFGLFEITLPGNLANSVDTKAGAGSMLGIALRALCFISELAAFIAKIRRLAHHSESGAGIFRDSPRR